MDCGSHIKDPCHSYRIEAQPRSDNQLSCSLSVSVWRLTVRVACRPHRDIMPLLLGFIQPDKQNRCWGEETSGCQSPISQWPWLSPLPGKQILLFHPKGCIKMAIIIHLKSSCKLCKDFCISLLERVHFSISYQLLCLNYLPQQELSIPPSKTLHASFSPKT